jgi:TOBE domain
VHSPDRRVQAAGRLRRGEAAGAIKVVARPERLPLLPHGAERENCLPGIVERTVYVGASHQVIVRLATGEAIQASAANTGETEGYRQGTPVAVHVPADALRVLSSRAPTGRDGGSGEPDPAHALSPERAS